MQRLIEIGAGNCDEIFDASRDRMPLVVDDPERRVAVLHGVGDDAQGEQIIHLVDRDSLALQLLVNGETRVSAGLRLGRECLPERA